VVGELREGVVTEYELHPEDFGLAMASTRHFRVADAGESKARVLEALSNREGPVRDIVLLNAGAALYAANVCGSIADGITRAREVVASGAARASLDAFVQVTRRLVVR
jgi:anthranilate phosphoribosyltransferase